MIAHAYSVTMVYNLICGKCGKPWNMNDLDVMKTCPWCDTCLVMEEDKEEEK